MTVLTLGAARRLVGALLVGIVLVGGWLWATDFDAAWRAARFRRPTAQCPLGVYQRGWPQPASVAIEPACQLGDGGGR